MPAILDHEYEPRLCTSCKKLVFADPRFTTLPVYCAGCVNDDDWAEDAFVHCLCCNQFMSDLTPGHELALHMQEAATIG